MMSTKKLIESIENKFLKSIRYRMGSENSRMVVVELKGHFGLEGLKDEIIFLDICFIFQLLNNTTISPERKRIYSVVN